MKINRISILIFLLLATLGVCGQQNPLNIRITASYKNVPLGEVLMDIAERNHFQLAYNASHINEDSLVSISVNKKPVSKVYKELLPNNIDVKVVGNHVIFAKQRGKKQEPKKSQDVKPMESIPVPTAYIYEGFLINRATGQSIHQATVYDIDGKVTTITNDDGFFRMIFPAEYPARGLSFSKMGYYDTVIIVQPLSDKNFNIYLEPRMEIVSALKKREADIAMSGIEDKNLVSWIVPEKSMINAENLQVYNQKYVQVSLLPFIGSNFQASGTRINHYSLNIFAGYNGGVDRLEIGGFANMIHRDVKGVQIAGFYNTVGRNTNGVQLSGFFNFNRGVTKGVQVAGFFNTALDTLEGVQLAGFSNIIRGELSHGMQIAGFNNISSQKVGGVQLSGFFNYAHKEVRLMQISGFWNFAPKVNMVQLSGFLNTAKEVNALQLSGFANIISERISGLQLSGFANFANQVKGIQGTGFVNMAGRISGVQLSGFCNIAGKVENGIQITGFLNSTKNLKGTQIAVFNYVDTLESGCVIGLFNFVRRNGHHAISVGVSDGFPVSVAYSMGTGLLYTEMGLHFYPGKAMGYSLAFGSLLGKKEWIKYSLKLGTQTVESLWGEKLTEFGEINFIESGLRFHLIKHFSFDVAPAIRFGIFNTIPDNNKKLPSFSQNPFYTKAVSDKYLEAWFGFKASLIYHW